MKIFLLFLFVSFLLGVASRVQDTTRRRLLLGLCALLSIGYLFLNQL